MFLTRLGNKQRIAQEIQKYFPDHSVYIEPFFGAGGMFFNKPRARINILNDRDSNVYNCFNVLRHHKKELKEYIELMPVHTDFWNECRTKEPTNSIEKACYFLFLSNFGYMGKSECLSLGNINYKKTLLTALESTYKEIARGGNTFTNYDAVAMLRKISFSQFSLQECFIYNDPPYLGTTSTYEHVFTEKHSFLLFETLESIGCKWAMSEFQNSFILKEALSRNLFIHEIGARQNLKNKRVEILITNYPKSNSGKQRTFIDTN